MIDLVIWRHGRTEWNAANRFQGQLDIPLDPDGRTQASRAAALLARSRPVAIVSSDASRALDTARVLADLVGLPVVVDARLREIDLGVWSGLTHADVAARFPSEYAAWRAGGAAARGGGETFDAVGQRARAAIDEHLATARQSRQRVGAPGAPGDGDGASDLPLVVVTHGGTARMLVLDLLGLPADARHTISPLGNACWASLSHRSGGWALTSYNVGADFVGASPAAVDARG